MLGLQLAHSIIITIFALTFLLTLISIMRLVEDRDRDRLLERSLLDRSKASMHNQDYSGALEAFSTLRQHGLCSASCLVEYGNLLLHRFGDADQALRVCTESLLKTNKSPWPCSNAEGLFCLAAANDALSQHADAFKYLQKLHECKHLSPASQSLFEKYSPAHPGDASTMLHSILCMEGLEHTCSATISSTD